MQGLQSCRGRGSVAGLTRALQRSRAGNVSRMWPRRPWRGTPGPCGSHLGRTCLNTLGPEAVTVQAPPDHPRPSLSPAADGPVPRHQWWWVPGAITVITIASVIVVTLSQLHPSMLLTNTTTTGGDTGAHIAMPKYLETLLSHGHLTGWDPGWYDGFPLYTFYFTIPDLFIAIGGWVIPYDVAFKLGTILGSVTAARLRLGLRPLLPPARPAPHPAGRGHAALPLRLHVHHLRREPLLDPGGGVRLLVQPVAGRALPRALRLRRAGGQIPRLGRRRARRLRPVPHRPRLVRAGRRGRS